MSPKKTFIPLISMLALATGCKSDPTEHHWSYEGTTGPDHWADLSPDYRLAAAGKRQSPIDLTDGEAPTSGSLAIDYQSTTLEIVNNGHTVQVNYAPGSTITIGSGTFGLAQFHFHSPSEHTIDGSHLPMEMHLVHANAAGELAVLGVFLKEGRHNPALARIWEHLPTRSGESRSVEDVTLIASDLLPADLSRHVYSGSLTTPPCSEGVSWMVLHTPIEASAAQIQAFRALYHGNNRPTQPLHGRSVRVEP